MNSPASYPTPSPPSSSPQKMNLELTTTIVICTQRRPEYLRESLQAVAQLKPAAEDVLVVDNTTGDPETKHLAQAFAARYVVEPRQGLSRARNRGLAESSTAVVAFLDDDAVPHEDWLGLVLAEFADPLVAAVTGETITSESLAGDFVGEPARSLCSNDPLWFEIATFGGLGFGTNMALRRSACDGWTVFDHRLGRGAPFRLAEESHAFASLLVRGHRAVHVPAAIVIHPSKPMDIEEYASSAVAYWLLLFSDFPGQRPDLVRFLMRRLRKKSLTWLRNPQGPGEIMRSGFPTKLKAALKGTALFIRTPRPRD